MKLYDKRDDFNFPIVNFPFTCSNIPAAPAYGVYLAHLIRYSRACGSCHDFLLIKLKSSLRQLYGRYHDLADRYVLSESQMTTIHYLSLGL
jgi:hypothetical protein